MIYFLFTDRAMNANTSIGIVIRSTHFTEESVTYQALMSTTLRIISKVMTIPFTDTVCNCAIFKCFNE